MKSKIILLPLSACLATAIAVGACSKPSDLPATPENETLVVATSDLSLASPISYGNLSLVPVVRSKMQEEDVQDDQYVTLAEAKKNDWIEITELPTGATVELLAVRNLGDKPILLLAGELLLGGKQDRVVRRDTVVPPGKTVHVEVYCVEHGRWTGASHRFDYSDTTVPMNVKEKAIFGGQREVWDEVSRYNATAAPSSTETTIDLGLQSSEVKKVIDDRLDQFLRGLQARKNAVGVIVVLNGQIRTMELFGRPRLFQSALEPLVRGILAEAAVSPNIDNDNVPMEECRQFVVDALSERRRLVRDDHGAPNFEFRSGRGVRGVEVGSSAYEAKPSEQMDGLLHGSYSKE